MLADHYSMNDYAHWGTSGLDNNGNVLRSHHYIPNGDNPDPNNPATFSVYEKCS